MSGTLDIDEKGRVKKITDRERVSSFDPKRLSKLLPEKEEERRSGTVADEDMEERERSGPLPADTPLRPEIKPMKPPLSPITEEPERIEPMKLPERKELLQTPKIQEAQQLKQPRQRMAVQEEVVLTKPANSDHYIDHKYPDIEYIVPAAPDQLPFEKQIMFMADKFEIIAQPGKDEKEVEEVTKSMNVRQVKRNRENTIVEIRFLYNNVFYDMEMPLQNASFYTGAEEEPPKDNKTFGPLIEARWFESNWISHVNQKFLDENILSKLRDGRLPSNDEEGHESKHFKIKIAKDPVLKSSQMKENLKAIKMKEKQSEDEKKKREDEKKKREEKNKAKQTKGGKN